MNDLSLGPFQSSSLFFLMEQIIETATARPKICQKQNKLLSWSAYSNIYPYKHFISCLIFFTQKNEDECTDDWGRPDVEPSGKFSHNFDLPIGGGAGNIEHLLFAYTKQTNKSLGVFRKKNRDRKLRPQGTFRS